MGRERPNSLMRRAVVAVLLAASLAGVRLSAQTTVTPADIQRLQDDIFEAATDLARLRTGDAILLKELRARLDDIRDEVTDLKGRLRKQQRVSRTGHLGLRDRIAEVRRRARSELTVTGAGLGPAAPAPDPSTVSISHLEIPVRTTMAVRLLEVLNPATARTGDRVEGATMSDFAVKGILIVPAGSLMRGLVTAVTPATSSRRVATLTVRFDSLTVNFRAHGIKATTVQEIGRTVPAGRSLRVRFE
jgi:hypothetical protein